MTLPHEEARSLIYAGRYLKRLLGSMKRPIGSQRKELIAILRHYPSEARIEIMYGIEGQAL